MYRDNYICVITSIEIILTNQSRRTEIILTIILTNIMNQIKCIVGQGGGAGPASAPSLPYHSLRQATQTGRPSS